MLSNLKLWCWSWWLDLFPEYIIILVFLGLSDRDSLSQVNQSVLQQCTLNVVVSQQHFNRLFRQAHDNVHVTADHCFLEQQWLVAMGNKHHRNKSNWIFKSYKERFLILGKFICWMFMLKYWQYGKNIGSTIKKHMVHTCPHTSQMVIKNASPFVLLSWSIGHMWKLRAQKFHMLLFCSPVWAVRCRWALPLFSLELQCLQWVAWERRTKLWWRLWIL